MMDSSAEVVLSVFPLVRVTFYEVPKADVSLTVKSCRDMVPSNIPENLLVCVTSFGHDEKCPRNDHIEEKTGRSPIRATPEEEAPLDGCTCQNVEVETTIYRRLPLPVVDADLGVN
jgi:hypothetical protein